MFRSVMMSAVLVLSQADAASATSIAEKFHQRYASLRSVRCAFQDGHGLKGTLEAVKGGYYIVTFPDRKIISDGKSVWNVSASTKTVVINSLRTNSEDLSLERILFTMLAVYRVEVISSAIEGTRTTLKLTPPDATAVMGGIERADVVVDRSMRIQSISVREGSAVTQWTITSMTFNPKFDLKRFTFASPVGWQTVDLR